jgi:nuclear cap-binding protein subunit 1
MLIFKASFFQGPILPGAHSIERFLIEEHLHQIIESHHLERKDT